MNGHLDKKTLVILDEPESHLHPEWINKFAEVLAVMIKEIGIHVLITTHSPNLLLALNVYAHEINIENHSHFYLAKKEEDNWNSRIECIDDNPNEGYAHLSIPLIEMSMRQNT